MTRNKSETEAPDERYSVNGADGKPDGNEGIFARNLDQGGGQGEDISKKYMEYSSDDLDHALPQTVFKSSRDMKRGIRLIAQNQRRYGKLNTETLLVNGWRGALAVGGYARGQALAVDTGQRGIMERMREKTFRGMTPEQVIKNKAVG